MKWLRVVICASALAGCGVMPLKGGKATTVTKPAQGVAQTVVQSDNPASVSKQDQEVVRVKTYTVPTGSRIVETRVTADAGSAPVTSADSFNPSRPEIPELLFCEFVFISVSSPFWFTAQFGFLLFPVAALWPRHPPRLLRPPVCGQPQAHPITRRSLSDRSGSC